MHNRIRERLLDLKNDLLNRVVAPALHGVDLLKKTSSSLVFWRDPPTLPPQAVNRQQQNEEFKMPVFRMDPKLDRLPPLTPRPTFTSRPLPQVPVVDQAKCTGCGECAEVCATEAISVETVAKIDATGCIMCAVCVAVCPEQAITMPTPGLDAARE